MSKIDTWMAEPVSEIPPSHGGSIGSEVINGILDKVLETPGTPYKVFVTDSFTKVNGRYTTIKRNLVKRGLENRVKVNTRKLNDNEFALYVQGERL